MIKRKSGHVLTISSVSGLVGVPLRTAYSASKFAVTGYYESLRTELAQYNIAVSIIYPGYVNTNISQNSIMADGSAFGKKDSRIAGGMNVDRFAKKALKGIYLQENDIVIAQLKIHALLWARWFSPSLCYWVMSRYTKSSYEAREKAN